MPCTLACLVDVGNVVDLVVLRAFGAVDDEVEPARFAAVAANELGSDLRRTRPATRRRRRGDPTMVCDSMPQYSANRLLPKRKRSWTSLYVIRAGTASAIRRMNRSRASSAFSASLRRVMSWQTT